MGRFYKNNWLEFTSDFDMIAMKVYIGTSMDNKISRAKISGTLTTWLGLLFALILTPIFGFGWHNLVEVLLFFVGWGTFYLTINRSSKYNPTVDAKTLCRFGFYVYSHIPWIPQSFWVITKNDAKHIFDFPWDWTWYRTSRLLADETWHHEISGFKETRIDAESLDIWYEEHPYRYVCNDGTIQDVFATVSVVEREWRWKWFKFTPFISKVSRDIEVEFSEGIGEGVTSWKGGVLGCSYDMKKGDTPFLTLRRMERERRFER